MKWLALWVRRAFCYHLKERITDGRYRGCYTCNRCGAVWNGAEGDYRYGSFKMQIHPTERTR